MNYTWYETKEKVVLVLYIEEAEKKEILIEQIPLGIHVRIDEEVHNIRIVHGFILVKKVTYAQKIEVVLEKKEKKKWNGLLPVAHVLERNKETQEVEETEYSPDPIMNMLMGVYAKANDSAKREMNKSMYQSKGTELRTTHHASHHDAHHHDVHDAHDASHDIHDTCNDPCKKK
ncbi:hypothetical protein NEFER03_1592 [Nematocida sp. LUAm3]|nr:hypothetical protein NEFER03_1592 [Nematocida sp. LUAm3]KAI5176377.1 hypothetical protein NEFER02_2151 [Nematocida sp. LUAm2]KAI5179037.1 hypothetical protein NEFER01_1913 [Nematocida sp. LUAm1]